jgi:hypothetical protein
MNLPLFGRTAACWAGACWLALSGCGSDAGPAVSNAWFESDDPGRARGLGVGGASSTGGATSAGGSKGSPSDGAAERAIEEADIVKFEGERLYALSRYGGLSVIDVSDPDRLSLLGRRRVQAEPFELYVRDGIALVLYNGYGDYVRNEPEGDGVTWVTTGYVIAYDARDAAELPEIGRFEVPGRITDSRIVGDVLYVVGFENGQCWDCKSGARTTIVSLDVSDPAAVERVDEVSFADELERGYSWQRSVSVTDQRLYVAGPAWGPDGPLGSTIQVVDVSDPGGGLALGASVQVTGQVSSRWQMDEYEGVLRVVSQKGGWRPELPPRVETFAIDSTGALEPLGAADLTIPPGEDLRSVRFDGPRAYAITALQTDPLITLDLDDPEDPRQVGELEIPGWVYHMEPRGERVLGLGYDQGNAEGALAVSLFDVSDLSHPALLDRVNFGGDWAWLSEDQDRIHKAFNVLDQQGLILMPFSGSSAKGDDGFACRGYQSGVQLIDWTDDELGLRGVAPAYGEARRGFVYGGRLMAMSDERVESFDISDRGAPEKTSSLPLSHYVSATLPSGNHVVRVAQNWWTNTTELDVTRVEDVDNPESLARLEIEGADADACTRSSWLRSVVASGDRAYVLYDRYDYDSAALATHTTRVHTVDVTDPSDPRVLGDAAVEVVNGGDYGRVIGGVTSGSGAVALGSALVVLGGEMRYDEHGKLVGSRPLVHVLDLTDPKAPELTTLTVGDASGTTGLTASGSMVALGRSLPSPVDPERVRFFLDRIDVSDPSLPVLMPSLNVPGSLLAIDAAEERAFTVDYRLVREQDVTLEDCYAGHTNASFEPDGGVWGPGAQGVCVSIRQTLNLVGLEGSRAQILGSLELEPDESIGAAALGDDRLFALLGGGANYLRGGSTDGGVGTGGAVAPCAGCGWTPVVASDVPILVASGLETGNLTYGRLSLQGGDAWAYRPLAAAGDRALLSLGWRGKLSVIEAADPTAPTLLREANLVGSVQQLSIAGDVGIAALGYDGVQTISLTR